MQFAKAASFGEMPSPTPPKSSMFLELVTMGKSFCEKPTPDQFVNRSGGMVWAERAVPAEKRRIIHMEVDHFQVAGQ